MALDASIPLRAGNNALARRDPIQRTAGLLKLKHYQNAMLRDEEARAQQAEQKAALSQIASLPEGEQGAAIKRFQLSQGDIGGFQASQRHGLQSQAAQLELQRDRIGALAQLAGSVSDQATYERAKFQAGKMGIDTTAFPAQYDPNWIQQRTFEALTAKERLDRMLELEKFGETKRHHRATESAAFMRASRPDTVVNVSNEAQTEFSKARGKSFAEMAKNLQAGAVDSGKRLRKLERLDTLLDRVTTGWGSKSALTVKKSLKTLGFDVEKLGLRDNMGQAEAAEAIANEMSLELRNPAGGAGMPGAMSDKDREFLVSMTPGLAMTKQGRKQLIAAYRKLKTRNEQVARMARQYEMENGQLDVGFEQQLSEWSSQNEMFEGTAPVSSMEGRTATNPTTGERLIFRNGRWQKM